MNGDAQAWTSLAELLGNHPDSPLALLDLPLGGRSLTPGRCDLAPAAMRAILRRISSYDLETGIELASLRLHDAGAVPLRLHDPATAFAPSVEAIAALMARHELGFLIGGNNAITRPAVHGLAKGLGLSLDKIGLITIDAHFDLRPLEDGLHNGNPVSALLADGLPGANIAQIGLAPFANSAAMHRLALDAGIHLATLADIARDGIETVIERALETIAWRVEAIHVDFDIDAIARDRSPGAPGARPGGLDTRHFFKAARLIVAHPQIRSVDLTEFDPSLDFGDMTALIAGRWLAEALAGWTLRKVAA